MKKKQNDGKTYYYAPCAVCGKATPHSGRGRAWCDACIKAAAFPRDTKPPAPRESAAAEAARLIAGDRNAQYGPAEADYARAAEFYRILRGSPATMDTAADGLLFMVCVKLSRLAHALHGGANWKRDTVTDACGYLSLLNDLKERGW